MVTVVLPVLGGVTVIVKEPVVVALPLAVAVKVTGIVAVLPGCSGPKGIAVTLYGGFVTAAQLPLKTPLPEFMIVRWALVGTPTFPLIDKVFGGDKAPGRPAPLNCTISVPALLAIVAVAVLLVAVGRKETVSFTDFPAVRLKEPPGVIAKTEGLLLTTVPVRGPAGSFPEFLMVKVFLDGLVIPIPVAAAVSDEGAVRMEPFETGVGVAVGVSVGVGVWVGVCVGVPLLVAVAVGTGVGVPVGVTGVTPRPITPRPWVPTQRVPVVFCAIS